MRCSHCDHENDRNAVFCAKCGAWILASIYEGADLPPSLPEEAPQDSPKLKKKMRRIALAVTGGVLILALVVGLVLMWPTPESGYIYKECSTIDYYVKGQRMLVQDGVVAAAMVMENDRQIPVLTESLDGRSALYSYEDQIILLRNGSLLLSASPVETAELSAMGTALVYTQDDELIYFDALASQSTTISSDFPAGQYCVSPDGQIVAYIQDGQLRQWTADGNSQTIAKNIGTFHLIAVSNSGQQFYVYNDTTIGCYNASGSFTVLGDTPLVNDPLASTIFLQIYLNADHSQLLYYRGGYQLVVDGQRATPYTDVLLYPLYAEGTGSMLSGITTTLPVYDLNTMVFYSHYYPISTSGTITEMVYRIWRGGQVVFEAEEKPQLDRSGTTLFYLGENEDLMRYDLSGNGKPDKLADGVDAFFFSPDAQSVYYLRYAHLYRWEGMLKKDTEIADNFGYRLCFTRSGIPCYVLRGTLYTLESGDPQPILQHAGNIISGSDGTLYVTVGVSGLYRITDDGQAVPILEGEPITDPSN